MSRYREVVERLSDSPSPIIRYKTLVHVRGADESDAQVVKVRKEIKTSPIATSLLADLSRSKPGERVGIDTIYATLKYLADIDYPPGDRTLARYRDHVYAWLQSDRLAPLLIKDKYRLHGSFPGNAIYASVRLGIANRETRKLCEELLRCQWPGGGWNCSKLPGAVGPTVVHTAYGLRGLVAYASVESSPQLEQAIARSAEVLLERNVYLKRTNLRPLRPVFTKLTYPYPRLYSFMAGLHILTRAGYVADPRCTRALDLLEEKFIEGRGWPLERKLYHHNAKKPDGYTAVRWEDETLGKANQLLTVDALEILHKAGRL